MIWTKQPIKKEIRALNDAVTSLNSKIETYDIGNVSSISALQTSLETIIASLSATECKNVMFIMNTSDALPFSYASYCGTIMAISANVQKATFTSGSDTVIGYHSGSTWNWEALALNSKLTYTSGTPTLVPSSLMQEASLWEKVGNVVSFNASLISISTSSPTEFTNDAVIFTGLPAPKRTINFMAHPMKSGMKSARLLINTSGTVKVYWDKLTVPENGYATVINLTYVV